MFSVIVVDDEMMIRTSISAFINNCDVGFEVVGTLRDGSDAIKYLEEKNLYLEAENEALKKLRALVLQRNDQTSEKKR